METLWNRAVEFFSTGRAADALRALVILAVGLLAARLVSRALGRLMARQASAQSQMLTRRVTAYVVVGVSALAALNELGFDLKVLLGAAGVLTVALGFASQTSASNIISGLFLLGERPFVVGDIIRLGTTTGEVIAIDLMSIKLRTFDNLFVRIPNETVIKSEVTNLTHFPIRRYDLVVGVAYKEDLERVREVLLDVADRNPLCLDEPAPLIIFLGFAESSLNLQFSVWAARDNWLEMRNSIAEQVKRAFDEAGIEIPFPHRTIYTGSVTSPLPIELVRRPAARPARAIETAVADD